MQLRQQLSLDQKKTAVTGVESEPYRPKTECPPGCPDTQLIQLALAMEQQVQDFYRDSSDKLGFVEEIPVLFEDLAKDHLQNQKTLQTMS
jgi:rubrerythrin